MVATSSELQDGFIVGVYLSGTHGDNQFGWVKSLGLGGQNFWNDGLVDQIVDRQLVLPSSDGMFFSFTDVRITDEGQGQALALMQEPGARVPESVVEMWMMRTAERHGGIMTDRLPPDLILRLDDFQRANDAYQERLLRAEQRIRERFRSVELDSSTWTGIEQRIASNPEILEQIRSRIRDIDYLVGRTGLTNREKAEAKSITEALTTLINSPQPEWKSIISLLTSPSITAITNTFAILDIIFRILGILA